MATKTNRALNRLMGRLSALRQTLRTEERDLLDHFVLGATVKEVEAHRLNVDEPAVAKKVADRANLKANARAQPEVVAHGLVSQEDKKVADGVNMRVNARLDWDADKKQYRVAD